MISESYIVVTNNPVMRRQLEEAGQPCLFIEGLSELLNRCMALLGEGWSLAVDPLGGYLSRPNPYHTILLRRCGTEDRERQLRDVTALDALLSRYWNHREEYLFHGATERRRADHAAVDASIATRSLEAFLANG